MIRTAIPSGLTMGIITNSKLSRRSVTLFTSPYRVARYLARYMHTAPEIHSPVGRQQRKSRRLLYTNYQVSTFEYNEKDTLHDYTVLNYVHSKTHQHPNEVKLHCLCTCVVCIQAPNTVTHWHEFDTAYRISSYWGSLRL